MKYTTSMKYEKGKELRGLGLNVQKHFANILENVKRIGNDKYVVQESETGATLIVTGSPRYNLSVISFGNSITLIEIKFGEITYKLALELQNVDHVHDNFESVGAVVDMVEAIDTILKCFNDVLKFAPSD